MPIDPPATPADDRPAEPWLHVVLFQPEIPPNTGNIARTCVALGAKLWLVRPLGFRLDSASLRRAAMDYWQHLNFDTVDDWSQLRERLPGARCWLLTKTAERSYTDVSYRRGDIIVFGSETQGLPEWLRREHAGSGLCIPMSPAARSLNLANAVAIVAYEARRQLDHRP